MDYDSNRRYQTDVTVQTPRGAVKLDSVARRDRRRGPRAREGTRTAPRAGSCSSTPSTFIEYLPLIPDEIILEDLIQMGANDGMGAIPSGCT